MKYNENKIKELYLNEKSIWNSEDLDWLDESLVNKLQENQLPEEEKNKLIDMMANDQAVMNRYLQLKQQTVAQKQTLIEKLVIMFNVKNALPLYASVFALTITFIIVYIQQNTEINFDNNVVRGVTEAAIYPVNNSHIENSPEYFIASNKDTQSLQIKLSTNNNVIWISEKQQSTKFYLPIHIKKQLKSGAYSWSVIDKENQIIAKNNFIIR